MHHFIGVLVFAASPVLAEDWQPLSSDGIREALTARSLQYEGAWQDFRASGATLYNAGTDSWGRWEVRGDRYCSQWPPNASWACYDVALSADGDSVRFTGRGNDVSIGTYLD